MPAPFTHGDPTTTVASSTVTTALRWVLHVLIGGLGVLVIVRALEGDAVHPPAAITVVLVFEAVYVVGVLLGSRAPQLRAVWVGVLALLWLGTIMLAPDAAFLAFPLFFLCLHLLRGGWGPAAVIVLAVIAIAGLALHRGPSVGGVTGPLIGAGVALTIGWGVRTLVSEVRARERLVAELLAAQQRLAETERAAGVDAERTRMAAELHDTVAQSLSSIQLLLSAAERRLDEPADAPGLAEIALAKSSASDALAETRAFIRALSSPQLAAATLPDALARVAREADATTASAVTFRREGTARPLPRAIETTVLRIVQGAVGNAIAHAHAAEVVVTLTYMHAHVTIDIVDDGVGFDPAAVRPSEESGSFGLGVMQARATGMGGTLVVESQPGAGTAVGAVFDVPGASAEDAKSAGEENAVESESR